MYLSDDSSENDAIALLDRQLDAARDALVGVQQLLADARDARAALPATYCASWRSEASANYGLRLEELVGRAELAVFSLEQAEREVTGGIAHLERELIEARDAHRAAIAAQRALLAGGAA